MRTVDVVRTLAVAVAAAVVLAGCVNGEPEPETEDALTANTSDRVDDGQDQPAAELTPDVGASEPDGRGTPEGAGEQEDGEEPAVPREPSPQLGGADGEVDVPSLVDQQQASQIADGLLGRGLADLESDRAGGESAGPLWRVGVVDGDYRVLSEDWVPGRATLEVVDGTVVAVVVEYDGGPSRFVSDG